MATVPRPGRPLWAGVADRLLVLVAGARRERAGRRRRAQPARRACASSTGVSEETFCGPATAKVQIGGKTLSFSQGNCVKTADYVSVNIGTVVLAQTARHQPNYFGLDIGKIPGSGSPPARKDGSYRSGTVLTLEYANKSYDVLSGVGDAQRRPLARHVRGKTVTGQSLTGTFNC